MFKAFAATILLGLAAMQLAGGGGSAQAVAIPESETQVPFAVPGVFKTERCTVSSYNAGNANGVFYFAYLIADEPGKPPVATIKVTGNRVTWIEVAEKYRRQGIATELLDGLQASIGPITIDGTSPEGKAFADAWKAKNVTKTAPTGPIRYVLKTVCNGTSCKPTWVPVTDTASGTNCSCGCGCSSCNCGHQPVQQADPVRRSFFGRRFSGRGLFGGRLFSGRLLGRGCCR